MSSWRRAALVFLGLLFLSMVATRFQVVASSAVTAAILPVTQGFNVVADNLRAAWTTLLEDRDLKTENTVLKTENDRLRAQNEQYSRELSRLRQAQLIRDTQAPNILGIASIIAVDPSPLLSRLTVNRGADSGVKRFMPATVPAGLVGQVTSVAASSSVVTTLVDPESSVGVTLARNRGGRGLAVGQPPDRLRASFPATLDLQVGDELVTSSLGGVYPVGIKVGTVEKVLPLGPNDVNRTVIVKPAVDVNTLEEVAILGRL